MAPKLSPLKMSLTLEQATAIVDEALRLGREHEMSPLTVAVLDAGGHQVALKREDGSGIIRVQIACAKAYGALGMGLSSRGIGQHLAERPVFATALSVISAGQLVPVPGGVLIREADGSVIGAVGISGDTSARDEFAAVNGVKSVGLNPDPTEPAPDWNG